MPKQYSVTVAGKIRRGRPVFDRDEVLRTTSTWPDLDDVTITIATVDAKRSSAANRYLWGPVYDVVHDETGQPKQDIHDEMCARFTTDTVTRIDPSTGEMIEFEVVRGTSGMTVSRFHKFVEDVKLFWQEFGGMTFAEPGDDVQKEYESAVAREKKRAAKDPRELMKREKGAAA